LEKYSCHETTRFVFSSEGNEIALSIGLGLRLKEDGWALAAPTPTDDLQTCYLSAIFW
jgi:hypothetical protein